jgi:hypothetical protein
VTFLEDDNEYEISKGFKADKEAFEFWQIDENFYQ